MAAKYVYVDVSTWSTVVVCTLCNTQWGALDKEQGYRMAKEHRELFHPVTQKPEVPCSVEGCDRKADYTGKRLCMKHYQSQRYWEKKVAS